jgi:hypothetical protein
MSDEEKKAIESFKEENNNDLSRFDDFNSYTQFKVKRDKLIIDLIEKQSKEIEELKEVKWYYEISRVPKDKIKAKMKEKEWSLENYDCTESDYKQSQAIGAWSVLQSLLEKE